MGFLSKIQSFLFQNKTSRQTIAKNAFWLTVSQLGSRIIRATVVIYAARVMGVSEYGVFSYALGLAGFFTVFSDIGMGQIMTRESAKHPEERSYYFSTTFWIKSTLLILSALVIIFGVPHFSKVQTIETILPFVALLVFFDGLRDFALSFFRALEKMEWEAVITVLTNVIITISGFTVFYFFSTAKAFMISYSVSVMIGALLAVLILRKEFAKILRYARRNLVKPILASALPIAFSSALGTFMLNTDLLLLGWWQSAEQIGYYAAGQKVAQLLFTLPAIIASALFPTLARLIGEGNKDKIRSLMEQSLTITFSMAIPLTIGGILLGREITNLIFGSAYLSGAFNFQVLMVTVLLNFPGVLIGNAAIAYDRQNQITKYLLFAALSNAALDLILIPRYGIVGSSIATIIALTIDVGLCWNLLKRVNQFYVLPRLKKIIAASLLMGAATFTLRAQGIHTFLNIALSTLIYFSLLILLKEKILDEIRLLARSFGTRAAS